jgi:hypothetical protein
MKAVGYEQSAAATATSLSPEPLLLGRLLIKDSASVTPFKPVGEESSISPFMLLGICSLSAKAAGTELKDLRLENDPAFPN